MDGRTKKGYASEAREHLARIRALGQREFFEVPVDDPERVRKQWRKVLTSEGIGDTIGLALSGNGIVVYRKRVPRTNKLKAAAANALAHIDSEEAYQELFEALYGGQHE